MKDFKIITGQIGSGKTTMLANKVVEAKKNNKEVVILDYLKEYVSFKDEGEENVKLYSNVDDLLKHENTSKTVVFVDEGFRMIENEAQMKNLVEKFNDVTFTFHSPRGKADKIVELIKRQYKLGEDVSFLVKEADRLGPNPFTPLR